MTRQHSPAAIARAQLLNELRARLAPFNDGTRRAIEANAHTQDVRRGGNAKKGCHCDDCNLRRAANTERKRRSNAKKKEA